MENGTAGNNEERSVERDQIGSDNRVDIDIAKTKEKASSEYPKKTLEDSIVNAIRELGKVDNVQKLHSKITVTFVNVDKETQG